MSKHTEPTGERFDPLFMAGDLIDAEHQARYRLALPLVRGRRVLDAGCGVGWGSQLIVDAGAASIIGVDISPEAVRQSRERCPPGRFVVGDLGALPLRDHSVDVVVCFETLEHVADAERSLDEVRRVLTPGGTLLVSSPNPAVYPGGNPFHVHEMPPDELLASVERRFGPSRLFRQHLLVSSLISDAATVPSEELAVRVRATVPLDPGHDPYSVVVAGGGADEIHHDVLMVTTSHQLDALAESAEALGVERTAMTAAHERILAERQELLTRYAEAAERAESTARARQESDRQLRDVRLSLDELISQRASVVRELTDQRDAARAGAEEATVRADAADAAAEAATLEAARLASRWRDVTAELTDLVDQLRIQVGQVSAERDQAMVDLVRAEQDLARGTIDHLPEASDDDSLRVLDNRITALGAEVDVARDELDRIRATVSWRVTEPLRRVRRATSGRRVG